jgi:hypothetical protein
MITNGELGFDGIDPQVTQRDHRGGTVTLQAWFLLRRHHHCNGDSSR